MRIAASCDLAYSNETITLPGNLAILTDGSITMSQHTIWQSASGNHSLYLVSVNSTPGVCTGGHEQEHHDRESDRVQQPRVAEPTRRVHVHVRDDQHVEPVGDERAGLRLPVNVTNQTTLNYVPVFVPGLTEVTGFRQNIQYIREVAP